jgi:hypothetical protein
MTLSTRWFVAVQFLLASVAGNAGAAGAPGSGMTLTPHRAIYDLSLTKATQMDGVRAAKGTMIYTLTDRCDGYTVESNLQMELAFANGVDNQVDQRYAAWESKDGRSATFRMQVMENGSLTKTYQGKVDLAADGSGTATYETDKDHTFKLPKGTLLSTAHTLALLKGAAAGEKFLIRPVIDGSFEEGPFMVSAVIAPARDAPASPSGALANGKAWPMSLAYFPLSTDNETPQYEINMNILPNGVTRSMSQDFGTFTLGFDLARVEPVKGPPCP